VAVTATATRVGSRIPPETTNVDGRQRLGPLCSSFEPVAAVGDKSLKTPHRRGEARFEPDLKGLRRTPHGPPQTRSRLASAATLLVLVAGCSSTSTWRTTALTKVSVETVPASVVFALSPSSSSPPTSAAAPSPTFSVSPSVEPFSPAVVDTVTIRETIVSNVPDSVADRAWEPIVATHPTDPKRIAVVYQHRGPGAACRINPTIRISHDDGRTWRSTKRSPAAHSGRGLDLHAAIAWGPGPSGASRLYWTNMTTPGCGDPRYSLSTAFSDDEGDTWSKPYVENRTPPWIGGFPEIAVDRNPASPNHGTVYAAYNWLADGARGPGFRLLASADFGATWSSTEIAPAPSPRGYGDWWRIAYRLRTAPDGGVYASWYQADLRRWDRQRIFAKGGPRNVGRLSVAVARIDFDRASKTFQVGPSRIAVNVPETSYTTSGTSAPGTAGNIRPDPMWQQGFDVDPMTGRLYVAVARYSVASGRGPRGTIQVGHSDDGGESWSFSLLPSAPDVEGRRQSSFKPNLVAGPGYVLVTFHTLDDVRSGATVGSAYVVSTDGRLSWWTPARVAQERWRAANLGGVVNGIGLRERAERLANGDVFWAYGDGRHARGSAAGRIAVFGALISLKPEPFTSQPPVRATRPCLPHSLALGCGSAPSGSFIAVPSTAPV